MNADTTSPTSPETLNQGQLEALAETSGLDLEVLADVLETTVFENFDEGLYIGMMSGTSLDALDAVLCRFGQDMHEESEVSDELGVGALSMQLLQTHSVALPDTLRSVLLALCQPNAINSQTDTLRDKVLADKTLSLKELSLDVIGSELTSELDWFGWASRAYAIFASEVVLELLQKANVSAEEVIAIGCHGQTVRHRPQMGFSLQLVDANLLAERTGIATVTDFRRRDMAVGGQGAPLVPAFHRALFSHAQQTRVVLNLGGIANLTLIPNATSSQTVIGYDTGPANLLLDAWATQHIGKAYDASGAWGSSGQVIHELLTQLLDHDFFAETAPKSTGREDFNLDWLQGELERFEKQYPDMRYSSADVQATLTELTAVSASREISHCLYTAQQVHLSMQENQVENVSEAQLTSKTPSQKATSQNSVYVCGGGVFNDYLLQRLAHHLPQVCIQSTEVLGLEPAWVESCAFAWLARQTMMGASGNLPAVTGAEKSVVLGQVCFA